MKTVTISNTDRYFVEQFTTIRIIYQKTIVHLSRQL